MECVDELRHRLVEGTEVSHVDEYSAENFSCDESNAADFESTASQFGSEAKIKLARSRRTSTCSQAQDTTYDTFENCLQKANEMESVIAFYYQDENNPNVLKVTEIFSIDDGHNGNRSRHASMSGSMQDLRSSKQELNRQGSSELEWDNFIGSRHGSNVSINVI